MGSKTILVDREDVSNIELEEKVNFIFFVLHKMEISLEEIEICLPEDGKNLSTKNKLALRNLCNKFQITILDCGNEETQIFVKSDNQEQLIARWMPPEQIMRYDSAAERNKQLFLELHLKWWSLFEENKNE